MYNVITSFGDYPVRLTSAPGSAPGPNTAEDLGLMWLKHCGEFSQKGMLSKYRLILLLPREIVIPDSYNQYLDLWGEKKRFDENNKAQQWPLGPNLVFNQLMWLYHYGKLTGPFLWCEPDCIPVKPTWLDDIFREYEIEKSPFMGAMVDTAVTERVRTPMHMSGNAVYPDRPFLVAPLLMEARNTPFDVLAAQQILQNCHFTKLIQHERGVDPNYVVNKILPETVLFHPDKLGLIIKHLSDGLRESTSGRRPANELRNNNSLAAVFAEETKTPLEELDSILSRLDEICSDNSEAKKKAAYFMLEHGIVNQGHMGTHMKRRKKKHVPVATESPE